MQFFVGIDVSLDSSSICIIDERGVIIKEEKPTAIQSRSPASSDTAAAGWSTSD